MRDSVYIRNEKSTALLMDAFRQLKRLRSPRDRSKSIVFLVFCILYVMIQMYIELAFPTIQSTQHFLTVEKHPPVR